MLIGGAGNDLVVGGRGNDTASLGDGDDTFVWNPGDGSDTVFGGAGSDTLAFNGANVDEKINITANGGGFTFTRDVGNITMSVSQVETIEFTAQRRRRHHHDRRPDGDRRVGRRRRPRLAAGTAARATAPRTL